VRFYYAKFRESAKFRNISYREIFFQRKNFQVMTYINHLLYIKMDRQIVVSKFGEISQYFVKFCEISPKFRIHPLQRYQNEDYGPAVDDIGRYIANALQIAWKLSRKRKVRESAHFNWQWILIFSFQLRHFANIMLVCLGIQLTWLSPPPPFQLQLSADPSLSHVTFYHAAFSWTSSWNVTFALQ
jgi:hypothetical protein